MVTSKLQAEFDRLYPINGNDTPATIVANADKFILELPRDKGHKKLMRVICGLFTICIILFTVWNGYV